MVFKKKKIQIQYVWTVEAIGEEERALVWIVLSANKVNWRVHSTTEFETGKAPVTTYEFVCEAYDKDTEQKFYDDYKQVIGGYEAEMKNGAALR